MSENLRPGPASQPPGGTAPGGTSDIGAGVLPRRRPRRAPRAGLAAALAAVAIVAVGVALVVGALTGRPASRGRGPSGVTAAEALPGSPAATGSAYTAGGLPEAVRRLLTAPPPPGVPADPVLRPLTSPAALGQCLVRSLGPDYPRPLVVDLARWQGAPAVVAVYPDPGGPAKVDAVVVAAGCPPGAFLHYAQVRR